MSRKQIIAKLKEYRENGQDVGDLRATTTELAQRLAELEPKESQTESGLIQEQVSGDKPVQPEPFVKLRLSCEGHKTQAKLTAKGEKVYKDAIRGSLSVNEWVLLRATARGVRVKAISPVRPTLSLKMVEDARDSLVKKGLLKLKV